MFLPTTPEVARFVMRAVVLGTTVYVVYWAGAARQAHYQIQALQNLHGCEIEMNYRLINLEEQADVYFGTVQDVLGRDSTTTDDTDDADG